MAEALSLAAVEVLRAFDHVAGVRRIGRLTRSGSCFAQLELAGGARELKGFLNVGWGTRYPVDLRRRLPFESETIERIYSSHFLEHLYPRELEYLLVECARILKAGGCFEAALPNTIESIVRYAEYRKGLTDSYELGDGITKSCSATDKLVYAVFCDYHHRNIFAIDNLTAYLQKAGFDEIRTREFDQSIDLEARRDDSFYVVARKRP